jgi:MFS family permease
VLADVDAQVRRLCPDPVWRAIGEEVISGIGSTMTALALPSFGLQTTGSASRASVVLAAKGLPVLLLGIPCGTVAARLGAKRTILLTQLLAAPLVALIPLLHYAGLLTFPFLLVLVFCIGTHWTPFYAAHATIIPELLGEDETCRRSRERHSAGAYRSTYWLGPLAAGFFIAAFEPPVVLFIDAATFLVVPRSSPACWRPGPQSRLTTKTHPRGRPLHRTHAAASLHHISPGIEPGILPVTHSRVARPRVRPLRAGPEGGGILDGTPSGGLVFARAFTALFGSPFNA